jgi:hypothetical protein
LYGWFRNKTLTAFAAIAVKRGDVMRRRNRMRASVVFAGDAFINDNIFAAGKAAVVLVRPETGAAWAKLIQSFGVFAEVLQQTVEIISN